MILFKKQLFDFEVKGQGPTKVIKVNDTLFDLEVKGPTKVIKVCDILPYGHAPTYQISLICLERQKCYGPDKKILFKKQLFDFEVKGQGPTKIIKVNDTLFDLKVKVLQRSLRYATYRLMVMHPHTKYH